MNALTTQMEMNMDNTFLPLIFRMRHIRRWSLMRNTQTENLTEHSAECAFVVNLLAVIGNKYFGRDWDVNKLMAFALFHDITEVLTGGLPTPVKYFSPDMRDTYKGIERVAGEKLLAHLPVDLQGEYAGYISGSGLNGDERLLLKCADKLCAYIKCVQELDAGNKEFRHALAALRKQIDKMECVELQYFIEHCMAAFTMSLDELKGML